MTVEEAAALIVESCQQLGIPVMVVGSLSSNYYGFPRSTNDADLVVQLQSGQLHELAQRLAPTFTLNPQPSFETITGTTKYVLELQDRAFFVELFALSDDEHDCERFSRRRQVEMNGLQLWIPTAEDVIVFKLRWYARGGREKDWLDARSVMAVQFDKLDWIYIDRWCRQYGLENQLEKLRTTARPVTEADSPL